MLRELLGLMPERILSCSLGAALTLAVVGAGLWLAGARFSRSLTTLIAVAIGTTVGLHLPGWLGWSIDGMGLAVGGAVILGASGYLLDRTWVGLWLGAILSIWAGAAVCLLMAGGTAWKWPAIAGAGGVWALLSRQWEQLPSQLNPAMPLACAAGFAAGVLLTVLWPTLSKVLTWSLAGTTLFVVMGGVAMQNGRPQWFAKVPGHAPAQWLGLAVLVLLGSVVQWGLTPRTSTTPPPAQPQRARSQGQAVGI